MRRHAGFLREQLGEGGAASENDCPATDAELMDWVAAGINHGRRVQREQPETVGRIFAEAGVEALAGALEVAREMVAAVSGIDPASLLPALKRWHKHVYAGEEPEFYGQAVERVALFADFAVWIPWGTSRSPRKRKRAVTCTAPAPIP